MKIKRTMKKVVSILLILISTFFIPITVNAATIEYQEHPMTQIYDYRPATGSYLTTVTTGQEIYAIQRPQAISEINGKTCISMLQQPNVFCVQFGNVLSEGWYRVGEERTVTDPVLAYILCHGPSMASMEGSIQDSTYYIHEPAQRALWYYMYESKSADRQYLAGGSGFWQKDGVKYMKNSLYEEALRYAAHRTTQPTIELQLDGNNLRIKVNGSFTKYRILINGSYYGGTYEKEANQLQEKIVDVSTYTTSQLNVRIEAYSTTYSATYRLLTKADQQRLIIVTGKKVDDQVSGWVERNIELQTNVSLQKYITKVNGTNVESRLNKKATESTVDPIHSIAGIVNSSGSTKYSNPVQIEAGDNVTYRIYVYNNSNIRISKIEVTDYLPPYIDKYSINHGVFQNVPSDRQIKYNVSNLNGGKEAYFEVTVHFSQYSKDILTNSAKITGTTPENKTSYRIEDADYVKMKEYAVSLEKYVSNVSNHALDSVNLSAYKEILDYLNTHEDETLANLISKNKNISDYKDYDLNKDGKVNNTDVALYNYINQSGIIAEIQDYIKADLNKDGIVDETDLNIYKIIKANLYQDEELNEYDRYAFVLKMMSDNAFINEDVLRYLNVKSSLIKNNNITAQGIKDEINEYIKSDVDGNGYVNLGDKYILSNNRKQVTIIGNTYNLNMDIAQNLKLSESEIDELEKKINIYDVNNDKVVDNKDVEIFEQYFNGNRYNNITNLRISPKEALKIYENFSIIDQTKVMLYDVNIDGKVTFHDYDLLKNDNPKEGSITYEILEGLKDNLILNQDLDVNGDGKSNYEDYEILCEYVKLESHNINEYEDMLYYINNGKDITKVQTYNIFDTYDNPSLSQEDINVIKVYLGYKKYNEKYANLDNALYDINKDGKIDKEDIQYIDIAFNNLNVQHIDLINSMIMGINEIDDFINLFKEQIEVNADNKYDLSAINIDLSDIDATKTNEEILNTILSDQTILQSANTILKTIRTDVISNITYKDILNVKDKDISRLDINNDNRIDQIDLNSFQMAEGIDVSKVSDIAKKLLENDLNGDGNWDQKDIDLSNQLNSIENNQSIQQEIINRNLIDSVNDSLKNRPGKAEYKTALSNGEYIDNSKGDKKWSEDNKFTYYKNHYKYDNIVTVQKGDYVTYTIKVTNDSKDASVYISEITDYLPDGVKYKNSTYNGNEYNTTTDNAEVFDNLAGTLLAPGQSASFTVIVEVVESNMSVNILKNTATISKMKNKNNVEVIDTTPENNTDSDYIQMQDIGISGTVWNDKAQDKKQDNYNGVYDEGTEKLIEGVKVYLYRSALKYDMNGDKKVDNDDVKALSDHVMKRSKLPDTVNGDLNNDGKIDFSDVLECKNIINSSRRNTIITTLIDTTTTNANGQYSFAVDYMKGPKVSGTNRWYGVYSSYYVVFEYDGITYTSTTYADVTSEDRLDSNAREKLNSETFDGKVEESRTSFNNRFSRINNEKEISYTTENEKGYIPESKHIYNANTMAIQSSTKLITLSESAALEDQLKHINLGLKGRDVFDLELSNDVYSTKVTVNEQEGIYQFNNNKVTLRRTDVSGNYRNAEDAANTYAQESSYAGESYHQYIRKTDIDVNKTESGKNGSTQYSETGLKIEVTYKITVQNASITEGTATKITDYYDSKYDFVRAYSSDGKTLTTSTGSSGTGYKSVTITTPATNLKQTEKMEIYVVYELRDAINTLKALADGTKQAIPTYNMAEISEYTTKTYNGGTKEYTRGLLDKDSAPGSANREQVRLTTTEGIKTATVNGNPTTVGYYFKANGIDQLKYEDDTYASPTLYFAAPEGDLRTITGTVYEDKTTINPETRIKTGNGKLDKGEVGIYGATVELVEKTGNGIVRYSVTTGVDGKYSIKGFLPGNYYIRYRYGDTTKTVLLHQSKNGKVDVNKQSYNGEDYQSTNNTGNYGAAKLNTTRNFWYVYNEKEQVSTGTDNVSRRNSVSKAVTDFTDEKMTILNNMRDMIGSYTAADGGTLTANKKYNLEKTEVIEIAETKVTGIDEIIKATQMESRTPDMLLTVEKTEIIDNKLTQISTFRDYLIEHMDLGIAEVPVTTIDLQKHVQSFTITDSTGNNVLASVNRNNNGKWEVKGEVIAPDKGDIDVSIEDERLQGARLQVTYAINTKMTTEKNFDNRELVVPTITNIIDFIDNNLTYNESLGENSRYWELTTYEDAAKIFAKAQYKDGSIPRGTIDPDGKMFTTLVKAKGDNPILLNKAGEGTATVTLEKILSSTDATLEQIITSTVDAYVYSNTIEIAGIDYKNVTSTDPNSDPQRDRVRTPDRYIIIPGVQHDSETSEIITIHPPTGDSSINIMYFVIAVISLVILAGGTFGIRKFVLSNKK